MEKQGIAGKGEKENGKVKNGRGEERGEEITMMKETEKESELMGGRNGTERKRRGEGGGVGDRWRRREEKKKN